MELKCLNDSVHKKQDSDIESNLLKVRSNLMQSASSGVFWSSISQFFCQVFHFLSIAVLSRILLPADFGVVGMAVIVTGLVIVVNESGLSAAIIQNKGITDVELSTAFWINIATGTVLCTITILISPLIAALFRNHLVQTVISILAPGFIIGAFSITPKAILQKNLEFKRLATVEIAGEVTYGVAAIGLAIGGIGLWSLVIAMLARSLVGTALVWRVCPWRPSKHFNLQSFSPLFVFGLFILGSLLLTYFTSNLDYFFVGKFHGASALGYYTLAYQLAILPPMKLSLIITRVAFPAFSAIQDDEQRLRRVFTKMTMIISLVIYPIMLILLVVAPELIKLVYSAKWLATILPLQILCIGGILYTLFTSFTALYKAKNKPNIPFWTNLLQLCATFVLIAVGIRYNIVGVAIAVTIANFIASAWLIVIANLVLKLKFADYRKIFQSPFTASIVMLIVLVAYRTIIGKIFNLSDLLLFCTSVSLGLFVYIAVLRFLRKDDLEATLGFILPLLSPILRIVKLDYIPGIRSRL